MAEGESPAAGFRGNYCEYELDRDRRFGARPISTPASLIASWCGIVILDRARWLTSPASYSDELEYACGVKRDICRA